jgi:hypothetical protein
MVTNTDILKLKELYASLDRHKDAGEDVVADIRQEINSLELQYIKENVFPELLQFLSSRISWLRCSIDASIQFDGDKMLDYSFCKSGSSLFVREKFDCEVADGNFNINPFLADTITIRENVAHAPVVRPSDLGTLIDPAFTNSATVRIESYSEKAFAVYGNTKPFSEVFKDKGGYFNPRLRGGMGWIFSKKREKEIRELLKSELREEPLQLPSEIQPQCLVKTESPHATDITTTQKGLKCTPEGFRTYLSSKKNNNGRNFSPSSIGAYCTATRSNYVRSKVLNYHHSGYIYDLTDPSVISHLYDDIQNDFVNKETSSVYPQAVRQYMEFVVDCINPRPDTKCEEHNVVADTETLELIKDRAIKGKPSETAWIVINSIEFDTYKITEGNSTQKFIEFIRLIGPELVYEMKIPYKGGYLVDTIRNLKYISACKKITDDIGSIYWLNTNSNTAEKIRLMKQIGISLGIEVKIETIDGKDQLPNGSTNHSVSLTNESSSRTLYSLNGSTPRNKRKTVLAAVKLYLEENPRTTWLDIITDFPKEIQGSYGVVATLESVKYRIKKGFDDDKRYFISPDRVMKTIDGVEFVVCHQWGNQFYRFQEYVKDKFGWIIKEI